MLEHFQFSFSNISRKFGIFATILMFNSAAISTVNAEEFTNFFGIKFVDIPAGSFKMGSCKLTKEMKEINRRRAYLGLTLLSTGCAKNSEDVNDNETPQHEVHIKAFKIGQTHITLAQYKKYLLAIGIEDEESSWNLINEEFNRLNKFGENAPVVQVSWNEVKEFLRWMNKSKPASDPYVYRFITEAEWEYACRAGETHRFCGSDTLSDVGWVDLDKNSNQHDVATKTPNAWGVYDMTGNVWEWVEDVYHETYEGAPTDGSAWTALNDLQITSRELLGDQLRVSHDGKARRVSHSEFSKVQFQYDRENTGVAWKRDTGHSRVLRGGSWRFGKHMARATYRLSGEPGNWYYGNGFRIAAFIPKDVNKQDK